MSRNIRTRAVPPVVIGAALAGLWWWFHWLWPDLTALQLFLTFWPVTLWTILAIVVVALVTFSPGNEL